MSNSGKLMMSISIIFILISLMFLITTIIELCQINPDDVLISVREGGCFDSPKAVMDSVYMSYVWQILFWTALTLWHTLSAIENGRK
jgi:hypothetical protein